MAWTVVSKQRHGQDCPCHTVWLGQSCPSESTDTTVRATGVVGETPSVRTPSPVLLYPF
ncbi:MAG: hypothetical protein NZ874_06095 [Fimbriimonadales bacterium]|nr:hypothetical protein [Fimbriimonadales bacterium]